MESIIPGDGECDMCLLHQYEEQLHSLKVDLTKVSHDILALDDDDDDLV